MNSSSPSSLRNLHQLIASGMLIAAALMALSVLAHGQTRIKDVATVEGARDNQLIGYGIVAGLDGLGDSDKQFTQQTISNLARKFGMPFNRLAHHVGGHLDFLGIPKIEQPRHTLLDSILVPFLHR